MPLHLFLRCLMNEGVCAKCGQTFGFFDPHTCNTSRESILTEREKTHGQWKTTAYAASEIRNAIQKWNTKGITGPQMEALLMIAVKMARILSGDAKFKDHWDDIAGYAKLGSEACDG